MPSKDLVTKGDIASIEASISKQFPDLTPAQVKRARERLLMLIAKGLRDGFDVALLKVINEEDMNLKVIKLSSKSK